MKRRLVTINRVPIRFLCAVLATSTLFPLLARADWRANVSRLESQSIGARGEKGGGMAPLTEATGTTVCTNETAITPEIATAVRALRNDPQRIYEFVRNEIRYDAPTYGIKLGAHGCLLAGQGNDWDQAALLAAMLREAGYTTRYATSIVYYDTPRLSRWCGFGGNGDYNDLGGYVFYNGGWPSGFGTGTSDGWHAVYAPGGQEIWTGIRRVWVEADIGGDWCKLDPAFADCSVTQVSNLASVLSYDRTNLLAAAMQGATTNTAWVQDVNATNVAARLSELTTNLVTTLRVEYDKKGMEALIGGRMFSRAVVTNLPATLPYAEDIASASRTTFDHVPSERILSVTVAYQSITNTFAGPELGGRPLMITHDASASYAPKLWLNGEVVGTGTATTAGDTNALTWTIDQPYATAGWADDSFAQTLKSTNSYVLVYDFGSASRRRSIQAAGEFESLLATGLSSSSEMARLYAMNAAAVGGLEQWKLSRDMLGQVADAIYYTHHFLGVLGQEEGYYVDLPGSRSQTLPFSGEASDWETLMKAGSFFASALEHGVLEQTQGTNRPAASTIKIAVENNADGYRTFLADNANWSTVRPALTNYSAQALSDLDARMDADSVILVPENGAVSVRQWAGYGFAHFWSQSSGQTWAASMGMIIGGGYSGGHSGEAVPYSVPAAQNLYVTAISPAPQTHVPVTTVSDPVDIRTGRLLHHKPALTLGGAPPRGQQLVLSYSSGENARQRQLGYGWRHSLDGQVTEASDGAAAFGIRQASDAAAIVAASYVVADLLHEDAGVQEWTTAALVTKWALDQMNQNTVVVRMGDRSLSYVRMPDGSYSPPPGVTTDLIKTNDLFRLVERFGKEYRFNSDGMLSSIVDADDNSMSFSYNAQTNLQTVTDSYSRTLTFSYTSGKVSSIAESAGGLSRSVSLGYTEDDLTSLTDPDGGVWEYAYDTNHQIVALIDPLDQVTTSNIYNDVGQVVTQFNGYGEAWAFYCSGYEGTEVDPEGGETTHYFDDDGRNLGTEDALGNRTYNYYDAQGHLLSNVNASGFVTLYQYDKDHNLTNRVDALGNAWSFEYDTAHHLVAETDLLGNTITYGYDANHHLTNRVDALTNATVRTYYTSGSHKGLPHTVTDPNGNVTTYTYGTYGNPYTIARTDGGTVTNTWSARGDLLVSRDANGHEMTRTYNKRRLVTSVADALGNTVSNVYNAAGLKTTVTDPLERETLTAWTPTYNVASITYPDGGVVSNRYDSRDWLIATVDPRGNITSNTYDAAGRKVAVRDALAKTTTFAYDQAGNLVAQTNALNKTTTFVYDGLNRLVLTTDPLNHSVSNSFDAAGRLVAVTDELGYETQYTYDAADRRTAITKPDGVTESFTYDSNGNLAAFYNGLGKARTFSYDGMNRVTNELNAVSHGRTYVFDAGGNLTTRIDADAAQITYGYDDADRLTSITYPGTNVVTFAYDDAGNRTLVSNAVAVAALAYDDMNRVTNVSQTVNVGTGAVESTVSYLYDLSGNRTNVAVSGSQLASYAFDAANRLTGTTDSDDRTTQYTYNDLHRLTGLTYPTSVTGTWTRDDASRVTRVQYHNGSSNFVDRSYTLDAHANVTAMEINAGVLPTVTPAVKRLSQNAADELSNIQTKTNPGVQDWTTGTPTVDAEGNLTFDGTLTFTYDYENRLVTVASATESAAYYYAGDGSRVAAVTVESGSTNTTVFVLDYTDPLRRPLAELDEAGDVLRTFVWGRGLVAQVEADGATHYFHADNQGSTLALSDTNSAATDQWFYSPYGEVMTRIGTTATPYQWCGGAGVRSTSLGLYFMRARYYHAGLRRFVSTDPIGLAGGGNLYAYALRNPMLFLDANGLCPDTQLYWTQGYDSPSPSAADIRASALDIDQHNAWEFQQTQINPAYNPIYLPLSAEQQAALNQSPHPVTNPSGEGTVVSSAGTFYYVLGGGAGSQTVTYDSGEVVTYGFVEVGAGGGRAGLTVQGGTVENTHNPHDYEGFFMQGAASLYGGGAAAVSGPGGPTSTTGGYGSPGASLSLQYYFIIRSNRD